MAEPALETAGGAAAGHQAEAGEEHDTQIRFDGYLLDASLH